MIKLTDNFELSIDAQYEATLPFIAPKFGWYPETGKTPIQGIADFLQRKRDEQEQLVRQAFIKYLGEQQEAEVDAAMAAFDANKKQEIKITTT